MVKISKSPKVKQTGRMKNSFLITALFLLFEASATGPVVEFDLVTIRRLDEQVKQLEDSVAGLPADLSPETLIRRIEGRDWLPPEQNNASIRRIKMIAGIMEKEFSDNLQRMEAEKQELLRERVFLFENLRGIQGELQKEQDLNTNLRNQLNPPSFLNSCLSPLPLATWANLVLLDPFINSIPQWTPTPEDSYRGSAYFGIDPYVFWAPFHFSGRDIKLLTTGLTLNGGAPISKQWLVSCGLGYGYSSIDWKSSDAVARNIYFGPSVAYSVEAGYVRVRALGSYSRYHMFGRCAKQLSKSSDGWSFDAQVSGGLNFSLPAQFYLSPQVDLNYTFVSLHQDCSSAILKSSDFFRSKLALQMRRESLFSNFLITPQLAVGWVWMQPLSQTYKNSPTKEEKIEHPSSQQLYIDFGLAAAFQNGFAVMLDVESFLCRTYPIEKVGLKIEWNW